MITRLIIMHSSLKKTFLQWKESPRQENKNPGDSITQNIHHPCNCLLLLAPLYGLRGTLQLCITRKKLRTEWQQIELAPWRCKKNRIRGLRRRTALCELYNGPCWLFVLLDRMILAYSPWWIVCKLFIPCSNWWVPPEDTKTHISQIPMKNKSLVDW